MTEQMTPDVLEVLGRAAGYILCSAGSEHEDYRAMHDAIDKLSELISADVERVAAEENYITCDLALSRSILSDTHKSPERAKARRDKNDAVLRRNAAIVRQEAALAACRGLA